jgi:hypothetical protein
LKQGKYSPPPSKATPEPGNEGNLGIGVTT